MSSGKTPRQHVPRDANFRVFLRDEPSTPFEGYDRVVACDRSGVVQPVVYGADQFRTMVRQANDLTLEVMADGLFLAGDEAFRQDLERLDTEARRAFGVKSTATGWRLTRAVVSE
jgi:hypothetical protein